MTAPQSSSTSYGNPYITAPPVLAAGVLRSGGGGDGHIDHLVALLMQRINLRPPDTTSGLVTEPGTRVFDLAELVAGIAAAVGVRPVPPSRADLLRAYCWQSRTLLHSVEIGYLLKGALLFGPAGVGVSLGSRRRVVIYDATGGVMVDTRAQVWTEAARLPNARGYR